MFNQVVLIGDIVEIYQDSIDISCYEDARLTKRFTINISLDESYLSNLLLGNMVGIKGHIEMNENNIPVIITDKLDVLDARGKKYVGN